LGLTRRLRRHWVADVYMKNKAPALAAALRITRASVVKVIDTLESLGFVERQSIEGDRRSHALVVTEQGKNELHGMRKRLNAYELAISSRLSTAERAQRMALLGKVAAA